MVPTPPPVSDLTGGPWNPLNGHCFACDCMPCGLFWDTRLGTLCYDKWHDIGRRTKLSINRLYGKPPQLRLVKNGE